MAFRILKGDSSRISMDITPFHDGWCYLTGDDGGFYIDYLADNGAQKRICINPGDRVVSGHPVATDEEIDEMLNEVFTSEPAIDDTSAKTVATDAEVDEMLNEVFIGRKI